MERFRDPASSPSSLLHRGFIPRRDPATAGFEEARVADGGRDVGAASAVRPRTSPPRYRAVAWTGGDRGVAEARLVVFGLGVATPAALLSLVVAACAP